MRSPFVLFADRRRLVSAVLKVLRDQMRKMPLEFIPFYGALLIFAMGTAQDYYIFCGPFDLNQSFPEPVLSDMLGPMMPNNNIIRFNSEIVVYILGAPLDYFPKYFPLSIDLF